MSVAKTVELVSSSAVSFDDALKSGLERANKTLKGVKGAWIQDQEVSVENGRVTEYRIRMKVTFVLQD